MSLTQQIPDELIYSVARPPLDLVINRTSNSRGTGLIHSPTSNPILRFELTSQNWIDPSSVKLFANLFFAVPAGQNSYTVNGNYSATEIQVPSTMDLFSTMTISNSAGQIIQSISDSHVVNRMLAITASSTYLDSVGSFSNISLNPFQRRRANGSAIEVQIEALQCLGFLKCNRFINPSSLGGLVFSFTLNPNAVLFTSIADTDTPTLTITDAILYWDECFLSQSYIQSFRKEYADGYQIKFPSYSVAQMVVPNGNNSSTSFNLNVSQAKAVLVALRPSNAISVMDEEELAFISQGFKDYSFVLSGTRYGPIAGYSRAFNELLKVAYLQDSVHVSLPDYTQFSTDYSRPASATAKINGLFVMSMDLEKFSSHTSSGVKIEGSSQLILNWTNLNNPSTGSVVILHDVGMTVINGRVQIEQ